MAEDCPAECDVCERHSLTAKQVGRPDLHFCVPREGAGQRRTKQLKSQCMKWWNALLDIRHFPGGVVHGVCFGTVCHRPSPKVSSSPSQPRKQVVPTFVVPFIWLPGQCKNYQTNSFLAPSPVELCMGCALEQFFSSQVQNSAILHLSPESR